MQNLRALAPIVFGKGEELKERWSSIIATASNDHEKPLDETVRIDVCHWVSRATFDVIGAAGFGYEFNAIKDETNELFCAYNDMFEVAISQGNALRALFNIYFPSLSRLFTRLRQELLSIAPSSAGNLASLTEDEIHSLYDNIANLPFLNNVCRESLRLVPPVHSSIRVALQDDEVPTSYPVHRRDGTIDEGKRSVTVPKGSFVHVAVEGFNLDKEIWGEDAWEFRYVVPPRGYRALGY
ncbi:hypothetical protein C0993_007708 [Termitomyces sp. T159_Od127]|nr:hypothetical protein C0993_007708 [Termitomyces sp. T159_Od127]